jgi:hypothetical protein
VPQGLVRLIEVKLHVIEGGFVDAAELTERAGGLEVILLLGEGAELPLALVDVTLHDDTFGARDNAMAAGLYVFCTYLSFPMQQGTYLYWMERNLASDTCEGDLGHIFRVLTIIMQEVALLGLVTSEFAHLDISFLAVLALSWEMRKFAVLFKGHFFANRTLTRSSADFSR